MPPALDFIDLKTQQKVIFPDLLARLQAVLEHGQYIMGPEVQELEEKLAAYVGVSHCISCSSGTDALLMALMAYRIGPGDAVFTTPFTFIATAEVICLLGATPVFVDIDPVTFNLDSRALAAAVDTLVDSPRTAHLTPRGIITVDLFGQPAAYDPINDLAHRRGLFVIEDAAQSFGATYQGRRTGSLAPVAATSFFPAKPLGAYGDGGAVFTGDGDLAATLTSIRNHGQGTHRYEHVRIGINGRLDSMQAAVLLTKLEIFDQEIARRQEVAARYTAALQDLVTTPRLAPHRTSVWAQYSVLSDHRTRLQEALKDAGVPTAVYYPLPLHLQPAFKNLGYGPGDFPVSEAAASRIFSLPMHPYLPPTDIERIAEVITAALA